MTESRENMGLKELRVLSPAESRWEIISHDTNNEPAKANLSAGADLVYSSENTHISETKLNEIKKNDPAVFQDAEKLATALREYVVGGLKSADKSTGGLQEFFHRAYNNPILPIEPPRPSA